MTLNQLPIDATGKVENLHCSGNIRRRLLDLGIIKNTPIKAVFKSPSGDPTAYEIRGSLIALRKDDASCIDVKNDSKL